MLRYMNVFEFRKLLLHYFVYRSECLLWFYRDFLPEQTDILIKLNWTNTEWRTLDNK